MKEEKGQMRERKRERQREPGNRRGVGIVATNATAATVPKPGVTFSRPAFEEKRGEEGERERQRERER